MAYPTQIWVRGEKVSSTKLNHMEDGITAISANGAIDTANLANAAVTNDKLDQEAVDSNNIRAGAIIAPLIYDGAVTSAKIADGAVTLAKLADAVKSHFALADDVDELKSAINADVKGFASLMFDLQKLIAYKDVYEYQYKPATGAWKIDSFLDVNVDADTTYTLAFESVTGNINSIFYRYSLYNGNTKINDVTITDTEHFKTFTTTPLTTRIVIAAVISLGSAPSTSGVLRIANVMLFKDGIKFNEHIGNFDSNVRTLYFANNGNDSNDGLSANTPKQNPFPYMEEGNCTVLLKSGNVFYSGLNHISHSYLFTYSVVMGENLTVATYGGAERAVVSGLIFGSNNYAVYSGKIYNSQLPSLSARGIAHILLNGKVQWKQVKALSDLESDGQYYVDIANSVLYVYSDNDITSQKPIIANGQNGLGADHAKTNSNIKINGITIEHFGFGIGASISDSVISNNLIRYCGGLIANNTRLGNGIEIMARGSTNVLVEKNIVHDIYDTAMTVQGTPIKDIDNIIFRKNVAYRSLCGMEFWKGGEYNATGILFENNYMFDIQDITNGNRLTNAPACYMWNNYMGENDDVSYIDNVGGSTDCIIGNLNGSTQKKAVYENNIWLTDKEEPFVNPSAYESATDAIISISESGYTSDDYAKIGYVKSIGNDVIV